MPTVPSSNCHEFTSVDTPALDAPHDTHFGSKRRKTYRGIRGGGSAWGQTASATAVAMPGTCRALFSKAEGATEPTAGACTATTPRSIRAPESTHPSSSIHGSLTRSPLSLGERQPSGRARIPLYCRCRVPAGLFSGHGLPPCAGQGYVRRSRPYVTS